MLVSFVGIHSALADYPSPVLGVTEISSVQTFATADGTFANGWKWVFNVTVPTDETALNMKFADWTSALGNIPAGNNMQIYSAQSSNAFDEAHAVLITSTGVYSDPLNLLPISDPNSDLDLTKPGRQIQITMETKVPVGSVVTSYSTSYGIQSTDPGATANAAAATALTIATNAVVTAEANPNLSNINYAALLAIRLPTGAARTSLLVRLDAINARLAASATLSADQGAANLVIASIAALPGTDALALTDKDAVDSANTAFGSLTLAQRALVTNSSLLTADISKIAELQAADADAVALTNATNAVAAFEANPNESSKNLAILWIIKLANGPAKTALFDRIDAVVIP